VCWEILLCRGGLAARVWPVLDPEFVLDAAARERLLDRFGPDAEPWCDGLAGLVAGYCRRWGLELDRLLAQRPPWPPYGLHSAERPVSALCVAIPVRHPL
jgi:hypothetical protein